MGAVSSGCRINAGVCLNPLEEGYVIRDARGQDQTRRFRNITQQDGMLTVLPKPVTVISFSASKPFDGEPCKPLALVRGFAQGESVTVRATGSITNPTLPSTPVRSNETGPRRKTTTSPNTWAGLPLFKSFPASGSADPQRENRHREMLSLEATILFGASAAPGPFPSLRKEGAFLSCCLTPCNT